MIRKGPKGINLVFFLNNIINEIGNAIKLPKNITNKLGSGDKTSPITNINLISPPPKDSFLNKKFPNNIIVYIMQNIINPLNICTKVAITPLLSVNIIKKYAVKNINTSSGII